MKLKEKLNHPLNTEEIEKLIPFDVNIVHYAALQSYNDIFELMYPNNCVIIFLETQQQEGNVKNGHWICLTLSPRSPCLTKSEIHNLEASKEEYCINFFDSYGNNGDEVKDDLDENLMELTGQANDLLSKLLYDANQEGYFIEYNEKPLQKLKKGVNTCGRFVVLRILTKNFPLEDFQKFMMIGGTTPDEKSVILTDPVLQNELGADELQDRLYNMIMEEIDNGNIGEC